MPNSALAATPLRRARLGIALAGCWLAAALAAQPASGGCPTAGCAPGDDSRAAPLLQSVMWEVAELVRLEEPAGLARLVRPADALSAPLVVVLPDALGEDGRSEPYVESLLARGIATLVLGLGEDLDSPAHGVEPAASPVALEVALAWARDAGFDPATTAVMGFGLGGRAALVGSVGLPAAALYPGCSGLAVPLSGPALVLQGGDTALDCAAMPQPAGLTLRLLPGAGHAWDASGAIWPSPGPVLPDPAGGGRLRARADLAVTLEAAELIADWFTAAAAPELRSAAR